MANAKIINYGQPIGAGSTAIPDNTSEALDIESTDAKDYITIDTTDSAEKINLKQRTIITDPSGPSGNIAEVGTGADTLVVDGAHDGGLTIVGETGDPMRLHFVADDYDNRSGILAKARGSGGASATRYLDFYAGGSSRMIINQDDITLKEPTTVEHATLSTIGAIATALTGTFTATNGSTAISSGSSTAFTTELHVGSALKIGSEVFTVTAIASATALTLDSAFAGSTASGLSGTTDSAELFAVKTGDSKTLFSVTGTGAVALGTATGSLTNSNLVIGDANALDNATPDAQKNTFVGQMENALALTGGHSNTLFGYSAGEDLANGDRNTAIGALSGGFTNAGHTVYVGYNAGAGATGSGNVGIGSSAMSAFTGQDSVAIGQEALDGTASWYATSVGYQSLTVLNATATHNTALGYRTGYGLNSGAQCLFLGSTADTSDVDGANQIAIGYATVTDGPNKIRLGNASIATCNIQVDWTVDSDERIKENIQDADAGLEFINALRPVSFTRKHPAEWPEEIREKRYKEGRTDKDEDGNEVTVSTSTFDIDTQQAVKDEFDNTSRVDGLIAQEVKAAIDTLGVSFNGIDEAANSKMGIQYSTLVVPLIKAVQELTARVAELEAGD